MAHEIDETFGNGAFAAKYYGAWHDLGFVTHDPNVTAGQLLQLGGCDFPIFSAPCTSTWTDPATGESYTVEDPRTRNTLRLHPETGMPEILGQGGPKFQLWDPREVLVGFGDAIMGLGQPTVSTCGALDGGRKVFMSFEMPQEILVGGDYDEKVKLWLIVDTSFDQSTKTSARISAIRPVCANTLRLGAQQAMAEYTVKRTAKAVLDDAAAALKLFPKYMEHFQQRADALIERSLTDNAFLEIIRKEFGPKEGALPVHLATWQKKEDRLMELFTTAETQENARGTMWAGYNAVAEFACWERGVKVADGQTQTGVLFERAIGGDKAAVNAPGRVLRVLLDRVGALV